MKATTIYVYFRRSGGLVSKSISGRGTPPPVISDPLPSTKIKVDRGFISDLPTGKESLAIIRAVAGIGRTLGITTAVEGVETQTQLDVIHAEGFDEAQRYLFARPMTAAQVLKAIHVPRG